MRLLVSGMHIALGALVAVEGLVVLAQARVNIVWESGFYGKVGAISQMLLAASGLVVLIGLITFAGGVAYWMRRTAGPLILANSLALIFCAVPEPVAWVLVAGAALVVVEQYRHARDVLRGSGGD